MGKKKRASRAERWNRLVRWMEGARPGIHILAGRGRNVYVLVEPAPMGRTVSIVLDSGRGAASANVPGGSL